MRELLNYRSGARSSLSNRLIERVLYVALGTVVGATLMFLVVGMVASSAAKGS